MPTLSLILRDNVDRAMDRIYSRPQRLHLQCVTNSALWGTGYLVHNLHICRHAAKLSRVPQQQDSRPHFTMGYDSLRTTSYREPKLCEFGREIRIPSEPHGMAEA